MMRSLRALERTASTSRVLNLLAVEADSAHRPEYGEAPLFRQRLLNIVFRFSLCLGQGFHPRLKISQVLCDLIALTFDLRKLRV